MIRAALFALALIGQPALEGRTVGEVVLDIPRGIERAEIDAILQTARGRPYSPEEVDVDIRRLFAALPLRNVLVYAEPAGEQVRVEFKLLPRVVVGRIAVTGNEHLDRGDVLGVLEIKEGAEFREGALERIAPAVKRLYQSNGFFQPAMEVTKSQKGDRTMNVAVRIAEGARAKFGKVSIGGPPAGFAWLAGELGFDRGDYYSLEALQESKRRLAHALAVRGFRENNIEEPMVEFDAKVNRVNVAYKVATGPLVRFTFAGNHFFGAADIEDALGISAVEQLAPGQGDEFAVRLRDLYQSWGFHDAEVGLAVGGDGERERVYAYRVSEGSQRFIGALRFEGNRNLSAGRLAAAQGVRPRRFFDVVAAPNRGSLPQGKAAGNAAAIQQEYRRAGFLSARVLGWEIRDEDGVRTLVYRIEEGPQTRVGDMIFTGNKAFGDAALRGAIGLRQGGPFDPYAFEQGIESVRTLYARSGYVEAKVTGEPAFAAGTSAATVAVRVQEGARFRVGQVFLQGNTRTGDDVLRRNLDLRTGDVLNPDELLAAQRKLYGLGIFGSVVVEVLSKDPQAQIANLIVKVQEKNNGSVDFGLEVGSAEGVILSAEAAHRSLFGTARSLRARAEVSYRFDNFRDPKSSLPYPNEFRIETGYREPWLASTEWAGTVNLATERNRREKTYNLNSNQVAVGVDRAIGNRWRVLPHYWWEKDVFFPKRPPADCTEDDAGFDSSDPFYGATPQPVRSDSATRCDYNPNATDPTQVYDIPSNVNLGTYYVAGVESVFVGDYRNDRFAPTNGSLITYRVFYAVPALGSDFHFVRQDLALGNYLELAPRWIVAAGIRTGYIGLLKPTESLIKPQKYVLGGANSVRGFGLYEIFVPSGGGVVESREDGGRVMFNYQAELRFPLVWGLGGVLFQDAGQVWQDYDTVRLPLLYTAGTGLRYDTPIGPIRLDVGWKLNRKDVPCAGGPGTCDIDKVSRYEVHFAVGNAF
jgi:outer membrane protein insertion porin family